MHHASKIAVIGAGVAGLLIARALSRKGYRIVVFEEDSTVGVPPHCTGIISKFTADLIGREALESVEGVFEELVLREMSRGSVFRLVPRGSVLRVDRVGLEQRLARSASLYGTKIILNCKIDKLIFYNNLIKLRSNSCKENELNDDYDFVIVAGGYKSRSLGSSRDGWYAKTSFGLNIEMDCSENLFKKIDYNINIITSHEWNGVYYGWLFPLRYNRVVVGAEGPISKKTIEFINFIIKKFNLDKCRVIKRYGGLVLHGPPRVQKKGGLIYLGDAAGLVKPLTGGGLFPNALYTKNMEYNLNLYNIFEVLFYTYNNLFNLLKKQYVLARVLLDTNSLPLLVEIAAREYSSGELDGIIDYDRHDKLVTSIFRRAPFKAMRAAARVMRRKPLLALRLLSSLVVH